MVREIVLSDQKRLKEQKVNEWELGLRPNNNIIGEYRDPEYQEMKYFKNPRARGYVDLILTGQTASTLIVKPYYNKAFLFSINDQHNLVGKYGLDILGINKDYWDNRQRDIYRYVLIQDIKKILNA
jgi:hypothetical protein